MRSCGPTVLPNRRALRGSTESSDQVAGGAVRLAESPDFSVGIPLLGRGSCPPRTLNHPSETARRPITRTHVPAAEESTRASKATERAAAFAIGQPHPLIALQV